MISRQFIIFAFVGAFAALVNVVARYFINYVTSFELAVALAFPFGLLTAYMLSRAFVFGPSGRSRRSELSRFLIVNCFALVLIWGISVGLESIVFPAVNFTWHAQDIAHIVGVLAPAITSFIAHRYYSFAPTTVLDGPQAD